RRASSRTSARPKTPSSRRSCTRTTPSCRAATTPSGPAITSSSSARARRPTASASTSCKDPTDAPAATMRFPLVLHVCGIIVRPFAAVFLAPLLVAVGSGEYGDAVGFALAATATAVVGQALWQLGG